MSDFASLPEALQGLALLAAVVGAFLGTLVGVLPGWGRRPRWHCCCR